MYEKVCREIQEQVIGFIKAYDYETPLEQIMGKEIIKLKVWYKADYFKKGNPNYKKGIGDVIVIFDSNYRVIIKETISGTWCFAVLDAPYSVIEEVWYLSPKQKEIVPELRKVLEAGFLYRNSCGNLEVVGYENNESG